MNNLLLMFGFAGGEEGRKASAQTESEGRPRETSVL